MLTTKCPSCTQSDEVPESAIDEAVRCSGCGCQFIVHDAVVKPAASGSANTRNLRNGDFLKLFIGSLAVLSLVAYSIWVSTWPKHPDPLDADSSPSLPPTRVNPSPTLDSGSPSANSQETVGHVNYSLVNTCRDAWQREGWKYKTRAEQIQAINLMQAVVETDCPNPKDREATLNYIQSQIDSW